MKIAILATLSLSPLAFSDNNNNISVEKSKATEFLQRSKRNNNKANRFSVIDSVKEGASYMGQGMKNVGNQIGNQVNDYFTNNLESIEAWEEWKDGLEESDLPEAEVDALERCVAKCWWKDKFVLDPIGQGFEENRETYEDAREGGMKAERPIPCPQCCKNIPKALGNVAKDWPQIAGTCNISADDDANLGN